MDINYRQKTYVNKNIKIKALEYGTGYPILLVHGWPETSHSWRHQIKPLTRAGFKTISINMRGYAGSSIPKGIKQYDMLSMISDILSIINKQTNKKVILIGHDWGAPICWNTAALHPSKVSAVIGLSIPYTGRGKISVKKLWQNLYKNKFFYQSYFQKTKIPELELEKDIETTLRKIYYWCSADGYDNKIKTTFSLNSGLLEGLENPKQFPKWLTSEDLSFLIKEFKKSGFIGPLNRYRNLDRDWAMIPELSYKKIIIPSYFIAGEKDPVRYFVKGYDPYIDPGKLCTNFLGKKIIKNAGHWVQQEKPNATNNAIIKFLANTNIK